MSDEIHMPWLARNITVLESSDPTLVGLSGTILNETRRTIYVRPERVKFGSRRT